MTRSYDAARRAVLDITRRFLGTNTIQADDRDVIALHHALVDEELVVCKRSTLVAARDALSWVEPRATRTLPDLREIDPYAFAGETRELLGDVLDVFPLQYVPGDMVVHVERREAMIVDERRWKFLESGPTGPQYIIKPYGRGEAIAANSFELRPDPFGAERCSSCGEVGSMKGGDENDCRSQQCLGDKADAASSRLEDR